MNSNLTSAHFSLLLAHDGLNAKENIIDTNMDAVYWKKMKRWIISSNDYNDVKCKVQSSQCAANMTHIALGTIYITPHIKIKNVFQGIYILLQ